MPLQSIPGLTTIPPRLLKGMIPEEVGLLSQLRLLAFPKNEVGGSFDSAPFDSLGKLEILCVRGNRLTGTIPYNIGQILPHLVTLDIGENQIRGKIPTSIIRLASLGKLALGGNKLSGSIPLDIHHMSDLGE